MHFHDYGLKQPDLENSKFMKLLRFLLNGIILTLRISTIKNNENLIFQGFYIAAYLPFFPFSKTNTIICEHSSFTSPGNLSQKVRIRLYKLFNPTVITLSEGDKLAFQALGLKKVLKIYNPSPYDPTQINRGGLKNLISLGRFSAEKQFPLMIEIVAPLLARNLEWSLIIQGDGAELNKIKEKITVHHAAERIILRPQGSPLNLYSEGSIFLMTSKFEGLPMALIEAMTLGVPGIAFDCSAGLRETINSGRNGYLVPINDKVAYSQVLEKLMNDKELLENLSIHATQSTQKFSKNTILSDWNKVLQ